MADIPTEYTEVELPLLRQLQGMGWQHLEGDTSVPYMTERETFRQVLLLDRLRLAVQRINLDEQGQPWLDEARVNQAVSALEHLGAYKLLEANRAATALLLKGTSVDGPDGKQHTVCFIDYEHPERNDFLAINQFRVDPPWASGDREFIVPDVVLFVNGIPLVVIECKSPAIDEPLAEAITQLLRYSNQRPGVTEPEGAERLFYYNQLMVATCFYQARMGTVGALHEHYLEWKDPYPIPLSQVAAEVGYERPSPQQVLAGGVLRPAHLLDIVRNFTLFRQSGGRTIKIVPRYQQFRAVQKAVYRLQHGQTRREHGDADQRGGIIWHTQGSGKSLTMVFLVRKVRTIPELRRFKVVVVTDRVDLEKQLSETAALIGEPLQKATSIESLKDLLRQPGAALVFGMIQKFQSGEEDEVRLSPAFPVLNDSEDILVLVDEAHRSHTRSLHAELLQSLPNCARIGFTGTPIEEAGKKRTREIFGPFIDVYTIRQSQDDEETVRILYEGRTAHGDVPESERLDRHFEDMFARHTREEREAIKGRYATALAVLEAPDLIAAKATDMLRHYVAHILPNGFKAQVATVSRLAAVRYQAAFERAQRELVAELEAFEPALAALDEEAQDKLPPETRFLVQAHPHLDKIRQLEFAAVISGDHNDPPAWREWTEKAKQESRISRFVKPLEEDGLAFLIVKDMLLVGFDAPVEQVLYLDRFMKGHVLLQAIARVNRTAPGKTHGLVVDYFGVADHLKEALEVYAEADVEGALASIRDELPRLADRHRRVLDLFTRYGCQIENTQACVDLLRDGRLRAEFQVHLKAFLQTLDMVLPRPEGLRYVRDAKRLGFIHKAAANRYRDEGLNLVGAGEKVRTLIDQYIRAEGVDPTIPPVDILATEFEEHVSEQHSPRAQAAEMEHAARYHIRKHFQEDPVYYKKLSQRLEEILSSLEGNWEALVEALRAYVRDVRAGRPADRTGLDPRTQAPFLSLLVEATPDGKVSEEELARLARATVEMVEQIRAEISRVDFWRNLVAQSQLRGRLVEYLDAHDLVPFERQEAVADQIVQLAHALHSRLVP